MQVEELLNFNSLFLIKSRRETFIKQLMTNEVVDEEGNGIRPKNISILPPADEFHIGFSLNLPDFGKVIHPGKLIIN